MIHDPCCPRAKPVTHTVSSISEVMYISKQHMHTQTTSSITNSWLNNKPSPFGISVPAQGIISGIVNTKVRVASVRCQAVAVGGEPKASTLASAYCPAIALSIASTS